MVKNPTANAGNIMRFGFPPGSGRCPGGGHGNPLQYFSLQNSMNREVWWAAVHQITKSWIRLKWLSTYTPTFVIHIYFYLFVYCLLFSRSVVSDSLWPCGLQQARPPCPSTTPGACSNSYLLSRWCYTHTDTHTHRHTHTYKYLYYLLKAMSFSFLEYWHLQF